VGYRQIWEDFEITSKLSLVEAQSQKYITSGDLWDFLVLEDQAQRQDAVFLPLTLEMGSWLWVRKNPRQAFSSLGIFNPIVPHRLQRTLRRHLPLLDFLVRAATSHSKWLGPVRPQRQRARKGE